MYPFVGGRKDCPVLFIIRCVIWVLEFEGVLLLERVFSGVFITHLKALVVVLFITAFMAER